MIRGFSVILAGVLLAMAAAGALAQPDTAAGSRPAAETSAGPAEPQRVRAAVDRVLSRREFAGLQKSDWEKWLEKWQQRIGDAISSVLGAMPEWVAWVLLIWALLTLLAIFAHFVYVLIQTTVGFGGTRGPRAAAQSSGSWLGVRDLRFETVHRRARELREQGRWAEAIRYFYVAALLWLDERGRLSFERWKTERDYRTELANQPTLRQRFDHAAGLFEEATYGGAPATEAACDRMAALLERLQDDLASAESR